MLIKPTHISSFLSVLESRDEDHWACGLNEEKGYWQVKYSGFSPPCTFRIHLTPHALLLHCDFKELTIYPECRVPLYRYLLRQNEEIAIAKFGLSHDGTVSLMVEWPTENMTFPAFDMVVKLMLEYHHAYYANIQLVAQDTQLKDYLCHLDPLSRGETLDVEVQPMSRAGSDDKT